MEIEGTPIVLDSVDDLDFLGIFEIMGDDASKIYVDSILREINYLVSINYLNAEGMVGDLFELYSKINTNEYTGYPEYNNIYTVFREMMEVYNPSNNQMVELFTTLRTVYYSSYNMPDDYDEYQNDEIYDNNY